MTVSKHRDRKDSKDEVGLLALGTSGPWEVAIDETLTDPPRYFAQVEGPSTYLYFELATIDAIDEALQFLSGHARDPQANTSQENGELNLATKTGVQICLTRDEEHNDRYFLVIDDNSAFHLQFSITDEDLRHIVSALRDVKDDLEDDK